MRVTAKSSLVDLEEIRSLREALEYERTRREQQELKDKLEAERFWLRATKVVESIAVGADYFRVHTDPSDPARTTALMCSSIAVTVSRIIRELSKPGEPWNDQQQS